MRIMVNESHLTETECSDRLDGVLLSDAQAVTIASWWQSPGTVGHVLASFASGCEVDPAELHDDIVRTVREAHSHATDWASVRDLLDLYAWVTSKNPTGMGE